MATFAVSFRLEYDGDYSDRYSSVVDAIRKEADEGRKWEEMTSLFIFKSSRSADNVAS